MTRSWDRKVVGRRRECREPIGLLAPIVVLLAQWGQSMTLPAATKAVPPQIQFQARPAIALQSQPAGPNQVTPVIPGTVPAGPAPRIVLDKTTYDFGNVIPNSSRTAVFRFTNAGGGALQITEVKKCCGAVVKLDKQKLESGQSGTLTAEYRASQGAGILTKRIGLITNDPKAPQVELTITGKVVQTLTWSPIRLEFRAGKQTIPCPDITIKSLDGTPFSIKGFAATGQSLTADLDPTAKATEFVLKPKVDAAKLEALTTSTGTIRIELDRKDYPAIELGFAVIPSLQVIPSQIFVFSAKTDEPVVKTLQVKDNQSNPNVEPGIQIESVTAKNGTRLEVRGVTQLKAGCDLSLEIRPSGEASTKSFWTDQLVIKLKDGRELTVPVRVFHPARPMSSTATSNSPSDL